MTPAALLLVACSPRVELPLIPIDGGSDEQAAAARAELERFDRWIGAGRLRLAVVRFVSFDKPFSGRWDHTRSTVLLDEDLSPATLHRVLRHELCHAIDSHEELSTGVELFERLGVAYSTDWFPDDKDQRREAFANVCQVVPLAGPVLTATSCEGESEDLLGAFLTVHDSVWLKFEAPDPAPLLGEAHASFPYADPGIPDGVMSWSLRSTIDESLIRLSLGFDGTSAQLDVGLHTGKWHGGGTPTTARETDVPPGLPDPQDADVHEVHGWASGPAAAAVRFHVDGQPKLHHRLIVSNGGGWQPVPNVCVLEQGIDFGTFTALQEVWYAWDNGVEIKWTPIHVD